MNKSIQPDILGKPAEEQEQQDRYRAPALDKGLDILELLADQPEGLTRGEIVKALDRGPSEIYRMLERLVARQYVLRSLAGDRYSLSLKMFDLAHRYPPNHRLVTQALPVMDRYVKEAEQSCHLGVYDRGNVQIVAQVNSPAASSMRVAILAFPRFQLLDVAGPADVFAEASQQLGDPRAYRVQVISSGESMVTP